MSFIPYVLDFLFTPRETERRIRGAKDTDLLPLLSPLLVDTTHPATVALLPFREPLVRAAIHEAKYGGNVKCFRMLGNALYEYLLELGADEQSLVIIPLPLSRKRRRERGFNQCEKILSCLPQEIGSVCTDLLYRTKDTEHQTRLSSKKRRTNIKDAFVAESLDPAVSYVLIDDVITTGATMQGAIAALRKAGARRIFPIALAH